MGMPERLHVGLDLGTGGVRALAVDEAGVVHATGVAALSPQDSVQEGRRHEQSPQAWWRCTVTALRAVVDGLRQRGVSVSALQSLCVDGTSGTLVLVDEVGGALGPALMYNDGRASAQASELARLAREHGGESTPAASHDIVKARWCEQEEPERFAAARWLAHQADWIQWRLTGRLGITDSSHALKSGYDLVRNDWAPWLERCPELRGRLPEVVEPGTVVGALTLSRSSELGLPAGLPVVAGVTDGTAAFLASGAHRPGDDNTTLGTTLVFKRLASAPAADPQGLLYSHCLPGGLWLPGAASNTGAEWVGRRFPDADLEALTAAAVPHLPSPALSYPNEQPGERFPFLCEQARSFLVPEGGDAAQQFAAHLQGTALLERLAYQVLDRGTGTAGRDVFATGGAARSDAWLQLRADVTGRTYHRAVQPESAFGVAVLGAHATGTEDLPATIRRMVQREVTIQPDAARREDYDHRFERFLAELDQRGYR